ncbi:MAG: S1/P1 nuclease [Candidatus Marinimicrobia bacterium]|nr:S1/P1 nuclease [Candidatus Neomarinimicrobiota bacterium]
MKRANSIWLLIITLAPISFIGAWGYDGHRRINYIASRQINGPFGQFLKQNSEPLKWYAVAPDYNKKIDKEEFHKHFIDSDFYDKYPFDNIPKNYSTLVSKYGEDNIKKYGIAPWTIKETSDRIIDLLKRNQFEEAVYNMGVLGHYISDLHMPLHTVINYDGQFSGNEGIHKRWELHLVNKYIKNIKPVGEIETVEDPWTFSMKIVKESFKAHHLILEADTKARKLLTKEQAEKLKSYETLSFEKPYLDVLFAETGDLLRDRLGRAVIRLASIWKYCWEEAGKPELP